MKANRRWMLLGFLWLVGCVFFYNLGIFWLREAVYAAQADKAPRAHAVAPRGLSCDRGPRRERQDRRADATEAQESARGGR